MHPVPPPSPQLPCHPGAELIKRRFPDPHGRIDDIVAAGDRVAVRLTFRGTHLGNTKASPATGREVEYVSHDFYRIAGGLIAEEWICPDTATLLHERDCQQCWARHRTPVLASVT
jgi:SnoaL-like polyketide cyclase